MTSSTGGTYNQFATASGEITRGKVYCSFLLNVTDSGTVNSSGERVISMNIQNGSSTRYVELWFRSSAGAVQLGIAKNGGTPAYVSGSPGSDVGNGGPFFVVMSQEFVTNGTSDDVVKLWVNPSSFGGVENESPRAMVSGGPDVTSSTGIGRLYFNGGVACHVDELRLGTNWADIAPGGGGPTTTNVPVITYAQRLPQAFVVRGTNGPHNGAYQLLGTTNIGLPLTNWPRIAAHSFDLNGTFDSTSAVAAGLSQQFFRLLVDGTTPLPRAAPAITNQPRSLSVEVGQSASFFVGASGTAPLTYQWRFNTNIQVGVDSHILTLPDVQTSKAGAYFVIVSNDYGAITSSLATLTVFPASGTPDFSLVGFAAMNGFASNGTFQEGGTTGGADGALVMAGDAAGLKAYLESPEVYRVLVVSNIDLSLLSNHSGGFPAGYPTGEILVRSHKTLYSTNGATISRGTLRIGKTSLGPQRNIIIRNLKFRDLWVFDSSGNYDTYGWDYVQLDEGSHHVWVDHCDFEQVYDGMVDAVHGSDYLTVSWNVFRSQKKCSLIGHSNNNAAEDTGHLNVTYHHNYFVDVDERMPRMRFGNAHVFNTYCENLGGNGIQSTCSAATLVENSHWQFPQSGSLPTREENGGPTGIVKVVSCVISNLPGVNVQFRQYGEETFQFNAPFTGATPPYNYVHLMHPVSQVPRVVPVWAGVGKLTSF